MLLAIALALALAAPARRRTGPASGTPTVVTLGDSAISGEAGRWAGNTNDSSRVDALGSTAYWDTPSGESIPGCHRSKAAQAHIGGGVLGLRTSPARARRRRPPAPAPARTSSPASTSTPTRRAARARRSRCRSYAATHNVKAVVVMIGANNYGFADIVTRCVTNWLTSPSWWKNYCSDDSDMTSRFTATRIATETTNVRNALLRVATR